MQRKYQKVIALLIISCHFQLITSSNNLSDVVAIQSLQLVQVIHRHGDRTPEATFPNDPNLEKYQEIGFGELTNEGKQRQYELGKFLRRQYDKFLGPYYKVKYARSRSSDYDRTLMSASCVLAGLYSPVDHQVWNENISWQPIPVHTLPRTLDYMLASSSDCELRKYISALARIPLNKENEEFYSFLTVLTDYNVTDADDVRKIKDAIEFAIKMNWTVPSWTTTEVLNEMKSIADMGLTIFLPNEKSHYLAGGSLLKEIVQNMNNKTQFGLTDEKKINLYATHDTMLYGFLSLLGLYNGIRPPLNSAVIFEMTRNITDLYYVKILYRNDTNSEPIVLKLPTCTELCPWEQFLNIARPLIPENITKECKILKVPLNQQQQQTEKSTESHKVIAAILVIVIAVGIGITALYVWKMKTSKRNGYRVLVQS